MGAVRICSLSSSLQGDVNKFIERDIGVGRFRIMGVGPNFQQAHDVVRTSMQRNDVASTSLRRNVSTRFLRN